MMWPDYGSPGTHGSPELDEDAAKLEAMGADPGATLEDLAIAPPGYYKRVHNGRWQVWCDGCGGEGRLYDSHYGGNDPDVWETGPCPHCVDHPGWMDWKEDGA
jgi:hypothetical protein